MVETDACPYAGLNILDLSQGIAGPYCAALLGQQGAKVIKVEPPAGDWIRLMGGGKEGMSALAVVNNLGKRSICIDATQTEGRALILAMAQRADVLVENFRPGVMTKLGLDYAKLAASNPRIIYLSISGFGESGPYAHKPATDSVLQAMAGMALANRDAAGQPRRFSIMVPDTATALYAAQCVGAALYARDAQPNRSGRGRHVQVSLAECCAAFQAGPILDDFLFAGEFKPPITVPAGVFATRDGHVVLATLRETMWQGLCRALEREEWLAEPRFATAALRARVGEEINRQVAAVIAGRDTSVWAALFDQHDVLFAPVQGYAALREDPQMRHMGYFGETDQTPYGKLPLPRTPGSVRSGTLPSAPRAGEHTREILREFGYSAEDIDAMTRSGVVSHVEPAAI
ncbi:MAG: CoA transferase [Betaproteobacteria bacterium]|nr:MAG: CoA transferase [Betaproteobacteria bacterium]